MRRSIYAISDSFFIKTRGTALIVELDAEGFSPRVGDKVELHYVDGRRLLTSVQDVEFLSLSVPRKHPLVGVFLVDDPGPVARGSELHPAV